MSLNKTGPISLNPKYESLFQSKCRYHVVLGGRSSGKSFGVALFLVLLLKYEAGHKALYTRYTMSAAEKSIIPEFREKIELLGLADEFIITQKDITHRFSGSSIFFSGIKTSSGDQTANLKSLHGVTTLIIEEAEELVDENVFDKIDLSVRVKGVQNRVILIMNPATKTHWIYERFFEMAGVNDDFVGEKDGTNYILTTYLDNIQNIDETFIRRAEMMREKQPEKYQHIMLGAWLPKAEGVIYTNWKMGAFEYIEGSVYYGQDYGFSVDPTTLIKVSIDRKRKRLYLKELLYKPGLTTSEIAYHNYKHTGGEVIYVDNSEPRLIAELKERGMNVIPTIKGKGSLLAGIKIVQDFEIIVDPESKNIIKELNNYTWKKGSDKEPVDMYNHCFVGDTKVSTPEGEVEIKDIRIGQMVDTPMGPKRVLHKWDNGYQETSKYSMLFDTFSVSLRCTENHKIRTETGWVEIKNLKPGQKVFLNNTLTESHLNCTLEKGISQEGVRECTLSCGSSITEEKSLMDTTYTTKTKTHGTMTQETLSVSRLVSTFLSTHKPILRKTLNGSKSSTKKGSRLLRSGTPARRVLNGTRLMLKGLSLANGISWRRSASTASLPLSQRPSRQSFAEIIASQQADESLERTISPYIAKGAGAVLRSISTENENTVLLGVRRRVYDITVEDAHCYYANGILVSNCLDAVRYVCFNVHRSRKREYYSG